MKLPTLTLIVFIAMTAPAIARTNPITASAADTAVAAEAIMYDDATFEIDPCEVMSHGRRAECDYTATYSDGNVCDGYMTVRATRRGRVVVAETVELYCEFDFDTDDTDDTDG